MPVHHYVVGAIAGWMERKVNRRLAALGLPSHTQIEAMQRDLTEETEDQAAEIRLLTRADRAVAAHTILDVKAALIVSVILGVVIANLFKDGKGLLNSWWMTTICVLAELVVIFVTGALWPRLKDVKKLKAGDALAQEKTAVAERLKALDAMVVRLENVILTKGWFVKPALICSALTVNVALTGIVLDTWIY